MDTPKIIELGTLAADTKKGGTPLEPDLQGFSAE